jgi:predicted MFS family arabinose efflux permease
VEIAREMSVSVGTAGLLVTAYGIPGIVVGVLAGPLSDRYGRKAFLVGGGAVMSLLTLLGAAAPGFAHLLLTRVGAGIGAAVLFPNITAAVADGFPYQQRGRAMSLVIAMNSLAPIVGVPLAGLIAGLASWRISFVLVAAIGVVAVAIVLRSRLAGPSAGGPEVGIRELFSSLFADVSVRGAVASSMLGSIFWFAWVTYSVAFFVERFGLPTAIASVVVLVTGVGIVAGSQVGGRLGDATGHKAIVGWSIVPASVLLVVETALVRELWLAVVVLLLMAVLAGARFATNMAMISELAPGARGTLLAVNSSIVSVGIVVGTAVGGILIDSFGYEVFGLMSGGAGLVSALIVWRTVTERTAAIAAGEAID